MHIGPYSTEPATVAKMEAFAFDNGYTMRGDHHEIYLGDRVAAHLKNLRLSYGMVWRRYKFYIHGS